jgi:hypothetical protein
MEMKMPQDPVMLLSFVNTQLRDHFAELDDCCAYYGASREWLEDRLAAIDYHYDAVTNQFV